MAKYIVLNDGETFTNIEGCIVVDINEEVMGADVKASIDNGDIKEIIRNASDYPEARVHDMVESITFLPIIDLEERNV